MTATVIYTRQSDPQTGIAVAEIESGACLVQVVVDGTASGVILDEVGAVDLALSILGHFHARMLERLASAGAAAARGGDDLRAN